jgi:hypothetical protein
MLRLETRAREFAVMASLTFCERGGGGKPNSRSFGEAKDLKGSLVMAVRLETGRSIPGQDEGKRKLAGSLQGS